VFLLLLLPLLRVQEQGPGGGGGGKDDHVASKEEMSAMVRSREEAALKRVRALHYASIQNVSSSSQSLTNRVPPNRMLVTSVFVLHAGQEKLGIRRSPTSSRDDRVDAQRWSWLEEWAGSEHHHQQPPFDKDIPVAHQSPYRSDRLGCSARRSFVRPRRTPPRAAGDPTYCYDDDSSSAAFPGYMASTASAKAKFRSMSTPKERSSSDDAYSELCFPLADRLLSPIPSIASDMGFARSTRPPAVAQRSPRVALKGPMTPARTRSRRSLGHYSFGSEAALHQLQVVEHYTPVR
jgi:hypothetical protein